MAHDKNIGQHPHEWRPLQGMPAGAHEWRRPERERLAEAWKSVKAQLTRTGTPKTSLNAWLDGRRRAFAIETGAIEGLYTLKRGITEQLIAEGLDGVVSSHIVEGVDDQTIQGLLADQEEALEMAFGMAADGHPLTEHAIRSWHQLLTRHQRTVTGLVPADGGQRFERRQVAFAEAEKGAYKRVSNNPRRPDGVIHEHCPPEQVALEMGRLVALHREIAEAGYPTDAEAAWLHHRFVRTHPFRDGNGRVSRLLMAYVYFRNGEPPPVVAHEMREAYIFALENADRGNLQAFAAFLSTVSELSLSNAVGLAERALSGDLSMRHGNGGCTDQHGVYHPPEP